MFRLLKRPIDKDAVIELFINEYRPEYEYAREMRIPVTRKYVNRFLETQRETA